jgi:CRP/FNR family transcriptional regulator
LLAIGPLRILADMNWTNGLFSTPASAEALHGLVSQRLPAGTVLFQAGDQARAFVIVLQGRIEVRLTSASGREMLLYAVEAGQSCVQTTLGLLGDEAYTGTALTTSDTLAVLVPKAVFLNLMDQDKVFRRFVLRAFGTRMNDLTRVLEQVAFAPMEARLAHALLEMADHGLVHATQAELAARLGTAREVVTRHLQSFALRGFAQTERGLITLLNESGLREVSLGVL